MEVYFIVEKYYFNLFQNFFNLEGLHYLLAFPILKKLISENQLKEVHHLVLICFFLLYNCLYYCFIKNFTASNLLFSKRLQNLIN